MISPNFMLINMIDYRNPNDEISNENLQKQGYNLLDSCNVCDFFSKRSTFEHPKHQNKKKNSSGF